MFRAGPPSRAAARLPILAAAVAIGAGVGLIFPLLAEIQDTFGFSTAALGLISGSAFLSAVVAGVGLAGLADRGHARSLLVVGLVASGLSLIWFALATELWHFVAARVCEGLAAGMFFPAARKLVATGDPLVAGHQLGRLTSAELGGLLIGPVIGSSLTSVFNLDVPFILVGACSIALGLAFLLIPLPPVPPSPPRPSILGSMPMLRRPSIGGAALLSLALYLPVGIYDALWSRYLTDRGASTTFIGISLTLYAVPVILLAPWGGRVADRIGAVRASTIALIVIIPMTVVYGMIPWPIAIAAVALCEGIPQAVATPSVQSAMVHACRPEELAAGQGLAGAMNYAGAAVAAFIGPIVYEAYGSVVVFVGISVLMAVVFFVGVRLTSRSSSSSGRDQTAEADVVPGAVRGSPVRST